MRDDSTASDRSLASIGDNALDAQLHNHADQWRPPDDFVRISWDDNTFFGNAMVFGNVAAADAWFWLPARLRGLFTRVAEQVGAVMEELGRGMDVFGLIHADAHLDNVLFDGGRTFLIDFDDRGFGYRMYDVAVALWELRHRHDFPTFEESFVRGYRRHRPLPMEQMRRARAHRAESANSARPDAELTSPVASKAWLISSSSRSGLPVGLDHFPLDHRGQAAAPVRRELAFHLLEDDQRAPDRRLVHA